MKKNKLMIISIILILISLISAFTYISLKNKKVNMDEIKTMKELENYTGVVYAGTDKCPDCKKFTEILNSVVKKNSKYKYKKIELREVNFDKNPQNIKDLLYKLGIIAPIPIFAYVEKGEMIQLLELGDFEKVAEDKKADALEWFFEKVLEKD